ncbi:SWIB/MDM2 domain-containing protein [Syncephalastrum racemosum]|uniref:SWIB/MDM2 domain-containing protein n=1 Tax=Syncephalastrum racemosum TaxID=13706 RepID=A0A1X2HUW8_SYNRA|nr:SWIB/MDM2 domain-containing protein [Syncephalastrum racemosum]
MAQHHHHHHQQQQQQQQQQQPQQPPPPPKKKARSRKKRVREPVDPNAPPKPKRKTGLNKPLILSPALSVFVGGDLEMSRPEIVKILWNYIKDNNLQDPADRRYILCDDKLKTIFDKPRINSFGMNRDLSAHLTKKPDAEIVEADSKPAVKDEMTASISAADTGMNPTDTASSANSTGPGHDVLQAGPKATNAQHTSQGELVDTSPSVTAETPDVVTPREGESMLPTSTQANDNVQQQNHSHQHHSHLASPSTATTTTAGAASGTTPGAPSDHITSSGPSTNAAAIA